MALSILDGNQTATTLSTVVTSGQHITAHTVVSLGTQAVVDITSAISGTSVCVGNLGLLQSTVATEGLIASTTFIKIGGHSGTSTTGNIVHVSSIGALRVDGSTSTQPVSLTSLPAISGVVTANLGTSSRNEVYEGIFNFSENAQMGVYVTSAIPSGSNNIGIVTVAAGTNRIGVVTIGAGTVTIGAGISQIGSVTASISSFATSVTARLINPAGTAVTYAEVGTAGSPSIDVLSVQGVTAGTPINVYPMQGTTVSNTNFTSTTASTSLVTAVTGREVLTVFNEGAGNLHISAGATCTTIAYQVRLSAGDYWECPAGQLSLAHSAVYATAGTARICQVS